MVLIYKKRRKKNAEWPYLHNTYQHNIMLPTCALQKSALQKSVLQKSALQKRLTNTIANMGAINVQIALLPNPEDSQQLDVKCCI